MRFDYDPDTDSLYIELNPGRERKPGAGQEVVGAGDHDIVIDSFASRIASPEATKEKLVDFRPHLLVHNDNDGLDPEALANVPCQVEVQYSNGVEAGGSRAGSKLKCWLADQRGLGKGSTLP